MRNFKTAFMTFALVLGVAVGAQAQSTATDFVRQKSDEIIRVINTAPNRTARLTQLRSTVRTTLDFGLLAERSLGEHWTSLTPVQKTEFTNTLRDVIEQSYSEKLGDQRLEPGSYSVVFVGEAERRGRHTVEGQVKSGGKDYHVLVRLQRSAAGDWQLYDIVTDDISLTEVYAESFDTIIRRHGYDELLRRLKSRSGF